MWPNPQFPVDLVTFTEEIYNGKLHGMLFSIQYSGVQYTVQYLWKQIIVLNKPLNSLKLRNRKPTNSHKQRIKDSFQ